MRKILVMRKRFVPYNNGWKTAAKYREGALLLPSVRVGLCSWADKGLLASGWYPPERRSPEERLRYYAEHFDTVEVDASFYALPREEWVYRWASRTPASFLFHVKVFGLFTGHRVRVGNLPRWARGGIPSGVTSVTFDDLPLALRRALWQRFSQALSPLQRMGKMGYLLFQFPASFRPCVRSFAWLRRIGDVCPPFRTAIEVRHASWLEAPHREALLATLEGANMAFVGVDEPRLSWTLPPQEWPRTASWGQVVRFHGRNAATWEQKDATVGERFRYRYNDQELIEWRDRIQAVSASGSAVYAMFNNCWQDWSARNATRMRELLGQSVPDEASAQLVLFDSHDDGKGEL